MAEISKLLSPSEVGDILGVHSKTVQRMAARREIPSLRVGRYWRFEPGAISLWLAEKSKEGLTGPTLRG